MVDVTVLLSIYAKENPSNFQQAMQSLANQSWQNFLILIVEDGPLPETLLRVLGDWQKGFFKERLQRLALSENVGLGQALNVGLAHCHTPLVARFDTDDICEPNRLQLQWNYFQQHPEIDILSSALIEFTDDPMQPTAFKPVKQDHAAIVRQFPLRNPINHPAVMFRRQVIENAQGYQHLEFVEDYFLWARALQKGAKFYNFPQALVRQRFNLNTVKRRGGLKNLINEWKVRYYLRSHQLCGTWMFVLGCSLQLALRLGPASLRQFLWRFSRKQQPHS